MCLCVYVYVCAHTHMYFSVCMCIYACTCVCMCVYVCTYVYVSVGVSVCLCTSCIYTCTCTCKINNVFLLFVREMFFNLLNDIVQNHFKTSFDKLLRHLATGPKIKDDDIRSLFFGDYLSGTGDNKVYDEVTDYDKLTEAMERLGLLM